MLKESITGIMSIIAIVLSLMGFISIGSTLYKAAANFIFY